jgi:hypothetical protein
MRSTITPHPGLHSLYNTGSGGAITTFTGFKVARTGLAMAFTTFFTARLGRERFAEALLRRAAEVLLDRELRAVLVARITSALAGPLCLKLPGFSLSNSCTACR